MPCAYFHPSRQSPASIWMSLYREEWSLCQLNRHGILASPSELSDLLVAATYWELSDPTVQALWRCYAESFKGRRATTAERIEAVG